MAHEEVNLALMSIIINTHELEMVGEAIELSHWKSAMQVGYDILMKISIWKLVDIPLGKKDIGCKWIFKTKYKDDGTLDKHKA